MKIYNEYNYDNLRQIVVETIKHVFGDTEKFLDMVDDIDGIYDKYDFVKTIDEEFYIINRRTGEYVNWYKYTHIGRSVNMNFHPRYLTNFFKLLKNEYDKVREEMR